MAKGYWVYKGEKIYTKRYNPKTKKTSDALYRDTGWECHYELKDKIAGTAEWVKENVKS